MKKTVACIMLAVLLVFSFGCKQAEKEPEPTPTPEQTLEPTPEPTPTPEPEANREDYSETTGLLKAEDYVYQPIGVMIENSNEARPQTNLNLADVVYECVAESTITRFYCLFNDNYPKIAGPVRSARLYFININREWDGTLVHFGGPDDPTCPESYIYGSNSNDIPVRVDGMKGANASYFWRSKDRKAPHNAYTSVKKILDEKVDYTPKDRTFWDFALTEKDQANLYEGEESFNEVSIPFLSKEDFVSYKYDAETNKLYRFMGGKQFMTVTVTEDENGKQTSKTEQVCCSNLIVQYAKQGVISGDYGGRRQATLVGKGEAEYFINGKHIKGYWERKTQNEATVYYTEDGEQVTFMPGNTWVEVHPADKQITVK